MLMTWQDFFYKIKKENHLGSSHTQVISFDHFEGREDTEMKQT